MRPDFGCNLPTATAGGEGDEAARHEAEQAARTALARWESRVEIQDVRVVVPAGPGSEWTWRSPTAGRTRARSTFTYGDMPIAPGSVPDGHR